MAGISTWNDRVAVITGGASGIGKGTAEALRDVGATVVIADRDAEALAAVEAEGFRAISADVTDADSMTALADQVMTEFGRVDLMMNNAGVGPRSAMAESTASDWRWVLDVNLMGVVHGTLAFLPHLRANAEGGWIVNTASMSRYFAPEGYAAYVASKSAVESMSIVLAKELETSGDRVGVTVLHPGAVRTNIKNSLRNRPADLSGSALEDVDIATKITDQSMWIDPIDTGRIVVRAIADGERYAFTHPGMADAVEASFAEARDAIRRAAQEPTRPRCD